MFIRRAFPLKELDFEEWTGSPTHLFYKTSFVCAYYEKEKSTFTNWFMNQVDINVLAIGTDSAIGSSANKGS